MGELRACGVNSKVLKKPRLPHRWVATDTYRQQLAVQKA